MEPSIKITIIPPQENSKMIRYSNTLKIFFWFFLFFCENFLQAMQYLPSAPDMSIEQQVVSYLDDFAKKDYNKFYFVIFDNDTKKNVVFYETKNIGNSQYNGKFYLKYDVDDSFSVFEDDNYPGHSYLTALISKLWKRNRQEISNTQNLYLFIAYSDPNDKISILGKRDNICKDVVYKIHVHDNQHWSYDRKNLTKKFDRSVQKHICPENWRDILGSPNFSCGLVHKQFCHSDFFVFFCLPQILLGLSLWYYADKNSQKIAKIIPDQLEVDTKKV